MTPHPSGSSVFVVAALFLFMIVLACGSGWWMARFLPVRFNGEKVVIGLLTGGLVALATCGVDKLIQGRVRADHIALTLGWFFVQGLAGEVTVQIAARRRKAKQ